MSRNKRKKLRKKFKQQLSKIAKNTTRETKVEENMSESGNNTVQNGLKPNDVTTDNTPNLNEAVEIIYDSDLESKSSNGDPVMDYCPHLKVKIADLGE